MRGLLSDRMGKTEESVEYYQDVQEIDQDAPALYFHLGLSYIRLRKFTEAASEFEKLVRLAPNDDYARYLLALLYTQLNELGRAAVQYEKLLEKSLENKTQNVQLRRILSQLYFLDEDYAAVKRHCIAIGQLNPLDQKALYCLAVVANEQGQLQEAIKGFQEVIQYYPDHAKAKNSLAYLYAEEEIELTKALILVEEALKQEPLNGAFIDTLGWIYFKMGDIEQAIVLLKKASGLTIDPVILNHLAEACYAKGLIEEARNYWKSSLSIDPTQKKVRDKLKRLKRRR